MAFVIILLIIIIIIMLFGSDGFWSLLGGLFKLAGVLVLLVIFLAIILIVAN